jgi:hypothetical protein
MANQDDKITVLPPTYEKVNEVVEVVQTVSEHESSEDDRVEPTPEELAKLRRVAETIPFRAWYIFSILC